MAVAVLVAGGGQGEAFAGNAAMVRLGRCRDFGTAVISAIAGDSDCMMDVWATKLNFSRRMK